MKNKVIAVVLSQLVLASMVNAAIDLLRNDVVWQGTYEGDTANMTGGTTPPWSTFDVNTNDRISEDGVLRMRTTSVNQTQSFVNNYPGSAASPLMTVEWRGSVDSTQPYDLANGMGGLIVVANTVNLAFIYKGGDTFQIEKNGSVVQAFTLDTDLLRTYRVTYDGNLAVDRWKVYTDASLAPLWQSGADPGGAFANIPNQVIFGDYSSGAFYGVSNWDFISWTDAGAFEPVPEPTTLTLLVLGVVTLLFRRWRAKTTNTLVV